MSMQKARGHYIYKYISVSIFSHFIFFLFGTERVNPFISLRNITYPYSIYYYGHRMWYLKYELHRIWKIPAFCLKNIMKVIFDSRLAEYIFYRKYWAKNRKMLEFTLSKGLFCRLKVHITRRLARLQTMNNVLRYCESL